MAGTILEVCAVDDSIDGSEVMLEVVERSSPFVGLFAWGADLREAGEGLAGLVWADHVRRCGQAAERAEDTGVRILTPTAQTFYAVSHFNADRGRWVTPGRARVHTAIICSVPRPLLLHGRC